MSEPKMSREMAEDELARFRDLMGLTRKLAEKMDDEDTKSLAVMRSTLLQAIESGALLITDDEGGLAIFTPTRGNDKKPIKFNEPDAGIMLASDKRREGHSTAKTFAVLAEWTGENPQRFAKLKPLDAAVCTSLFSLFFS